MLYRGTLVTIRVVRYYIGIDEAGRGALAGPVCVGAVLMPEDFDWREGFALITKRGAPRLRDSKQLSPQQREVLFAYIEEHGRLRHAAAFVEASVIDVIGITNAVHEAAASALSALSVSPSKVKILLDAGVRVSERWEQESFVRGDERIPAIACASIVAKVSRDRFMERLAPAYSAYGFEAHKGYGTPAHRRSILTKGLSDMHRMTFCGNLRMSQKTV